ncbi:MAG: hypothetical protein JO329_11570 [Planctomycetaceae bacterium]|nr:hypothetical protein [Planctomycetaceae bacterium]
MDLLITIDTEADNQWVESATLTTENTRFIPRFQHLCDRFGFKPTYLCTYEMVTDTRFQDIVGPYQESGRAEIGAHLHPWSNPPFDPARGDSTEHHTYPHELPIDLFEQKMAVLTGAISEAFGRAPTSYRAGRYGFHAAHADVLLRLGYVVDCSVAPYHSWKATPGMPGGSGGPDFRVARPGAYFLDREDDTGAGEDRLLEVPITILFTRWPLRSWLRGQRWWIGNTYGRPGRLLKKMEHAPHAPRWLRPGWLLRKLGYAPCWFRPTKDQTACQLIAIHREARRQGLPYVMMLFHSSELMPAGSPNFPDEASIEALYETFEAVFQHVAADGDRGVTLSEFVGQYRRAVHVTPRGKGSLLRGEGLTMTTRSGTLADGTCRCRLFRRGSSGSQNCP